MTTLQRHLASPGQQALWTFHRLNPTSPAYNMVLARELRAELDPEHLCAAFALVLAHCEALHCGYEEEDGQLWMVQPARIEADVATQQVENLNQADVRAWLEHQADLPFELERGQVCRLRLLHNQTASGPQLHMCAVFHHISGDFFSVEWALELMFAVYEALENDQPLPLPEPGRYFDWLAEQREMQGGESNDALASFWKERLADAPAPLELTPDLPRPRSLSYTGEEFEQWLSHEESQALRALAEQLNISLFALLAGLFQVFMHRQSDQDDFLIGTPTMDRHKAKYKQLIGYTLNAIPLRARLKGNPRLDDCLQSGAKQLREGLRHRRLPLARIQEAAASPTLFRHMLTYMPNRREAALARFSLREHLATQRGAANELNLRWQDDGQRLQAQWRYSSELFHGERIARMAAQFVEFARAAAARPTARLSELPVCAPQDQSRLNGPALAPSAATAVAAFAQQVAAHPQRLALIEGDASLSYAELDQAASRLAERFQAAGLGAGGVVALALPRGMALLTAMLASWKAGAAYLCLDPALPAARRLHMLGDSGAALVVGQGAAPTELGAVHWLDLDAPDTLPDAPRRAIRAVHPAQPAYLIYTSGSTGAPKGVVVTQGNLIHYVDGVLRALQLPADASLTALATVAADLGYTAWFGALLSGRSLRLLDETLASDPEALAASLAAQPVDCLKIVPSHLKALLAVAEPARLLPRHCLVLGGEGLDLALVQSLKKLAPGCRIVNHYGPTETTVGCLSHELEHLEPSLSGLVPVGAPLANVSVQVLDRYLDPLPLGAAGELYVGGAGVASGYLGQPRLSAERFIPNPFAADGSRLYRTGDRARLLPGGRVEFLGRIDNQVKIRGFRVELGEIEASLKACVELRDAVVLAQPAANGEGQRLVAYLVPAKPIQADALRQQLAAQLPDYMLPAVFIELAELPRLANGKVDRQNLPQPAAVQREQAAGGAPRDAVEATLVELWSAVLARESVSIHDDFFALGGDSILALQLIAKARKAGLKFSPKQLFAQPSIAALAATLASPARELEARLLPLWREVLGQPELGRQDDFFAQGGDSILALQLIAKARQAGLKFSPKELFQHPRVAALAALLLTRSAAPAAEPAVKALAPFALSSLPAERLGELAGAELEDAYPLSPLQKGLLFHSLLEGDSGAYVNQLQAELNGPFDPQRFIAAWRAAVAAHPLLRTGVLWQGLDEPLQCVHRRLELPLRQLDWRELDADARREALDLFCRADRHQGFVPDRPPLQRLALMQLDAQRWWLMWSRHNLIADGWSSLALLQEVLARYAGETPPPRPAYREYIGWLAARPTQGSAPFWAQQLSGFEGAGSLPMLAAPRPGQALDQLTQSLRFDSDASSRLNAAARHLNVTLNSLIQAAWGLLLARYNDQPDVVFGAISSGRPSELPGAERMLGVFINTLPLRVQALPQLSVQAYVQAVQSASVALREHEQTPLAEILQASPRGAALFDTLLVFQNLPEIGERRLHAGGLSLQALDNLEQTTYGLTVKAQPGRELELLFSAAAQRLSAPALQALSGHFRELLLALAEDGSRCLGELPLLAAAERDALLRQWNQSVRPLDPHADMLSLFERQVQAAPQRQALVCGAQRLSYAELNAQANRLARWLRQAGVGCDQLVAVCLEREAATLVTLLAIHKAGGAYLPIDPAQPPARNADILEQAQPSLLLTREALRGGFAPQLRLVTLEALEPELSTLATDNLRLPVQPRQLAYSLYTSGSTGRPKGVQIERQAFVNFLHGIQEYARLGATDRLLAVTTLGFDIAGLELFLPLVHGACVVLASREQVLQPTELLRLLEQEAITLMQATPASWQMLVEHPSPAWQGLRVLCGGEALGAELAQRLLDLGVQLTNVYGPTETTVWSAAQPVQRVEGAVVPIGRPLANNRLYILDERLEPQPVGVAGELYIGGAGLARGYADRPELTAAAFVPNPFAEAGAPGAEAGSRLYRTGDLARYRADGSVEFLGRRDFQVKLRGFRIELGEIEACLERHPAVQQALVSLQRLGATELLVAYWQGRDDVSDAALAEHLRAELPAYMLPSAWVRLAQWPLNANGKVDRQALPAPQLAERAALEPLHSDTERQLAALWEALLPPQPLGRQSHFFEAGGHSLLATRLLARLRQTLAVELPLRVLLEAPQLWRMAERIDAWRASNSLSAAPARQPALQSTPRHARMPLSLSQQRLWLVNRLQRPSAAYSMAATLTLRGELDVPALQATFTALLERHEVLRTAYPEIDGEPWAVIDDQANFTLPYRDLSALPPAERDAEATRDSLAHLRQPFDLNHAPLLRAGLLKLADDQHLLHLALHHMVADGWSVGVLTNEFSQLYSRLRAGQPTDLPALPVQYADYAVWQRQLLSGARLEAELGFWRTALAGAPQVLPLPTDHPRPAQADSSGATHDFQVPAALVKRLDALAHAQNASLYMVLLAAFQLLLHRLTGSRDLLLGTDVAGREAAELEGLIGFFVNVLPLRSQWRDGVRFVDLLEQTKQTSLAAFEHQALPFDRIVEALDVPRERSRNPLVQALFVLQNTPQGRFAIAGLEVELLPPAERSSKFDMALFLEACEQGLRGNWVYASALFKAERIAALAADWLAILEQAASAPETLLELPTLRKEPAAMGKTPGLNAKLDKLKKLAPRASSPPRPLIKTTPLTAGRDFPLLIEPAVADLDPLGWARSSRDLIDTLLCQHAGLLFRGFALHSAQDFEAFAEAIHPGLFGGYGDLPKKEGGRNIYRSTPYPEREMILFHNESSHLPRAPRKQWFFCEQPSPVGGATPIVDCRELYRRLPPALAETFERKGLLYVRTFTKRLDVSWQEFFKTDDRAEVEAQCRATNTEFVWLANDELQTRTRCPAVIRHPLSGERSFFNQVQLHHVHCLEPEVREDLLAMVGLERMPRQVYFGDGSPISAEVMSLLGQLYEACAVRFDWQRGDVVMLDNLLAAHARDPYEGPRKIVVAMGDLHEPAQLLASPSAMELQD
ncbi:MAG: amino acid adenylation domain-containing protein [Pseudomonas sp.]|uniref:non-ribosomal peptide synthetase n=1 Tax=Pseudomonas sp. TaxID=306 RepID=UPI00273670F7|nr:non-ribosomal peptide synthetase [Pseudomonas sp.]MDP3846048.1 amino acid adenylation domain-containing protein [Pseudomonas sp.]